MRDLNRLDIEPASEAGDNADLDTAETGTLVGAINEVNTAIEEEIIDRMSGETTLQTNITNEATARAAADTALQADIDAETAAREAYDQQQDQKIQTLNGHYYPLDGYDFGKTLDVKTPDPADVTALNTYAMAMENKTDPADIIDGTVIRNLFDGVEFVYNATLQAWVDMGIGNITTASNTHLGVVEGTADPGDGSADGKVTVLPGGAMEVIGFDKKANKIVQQVQVPQSLSDYLHAPIPSILELPAGTTHTTTITEADIQEIQPYVITSGITPANPARIRFSSVSGDFYIEYRVTPGRRPAVDGLLMIMQKQPDGNFSGNSIYSGPYQGGGTFNNGIFTQVDWLSFSNYDMSLLIENMNITPAQVRELNLWKHISRSMLVESTKDLDDVRNDVLGELVSATNTFNNIKVDDLPKIDNNIKLHEKVSMDDLQYLMDHPDEATPGMRYWVDDNEALVAQITPPSATSCLSVRLLAPNSFITGPPFSSISRMNCLIPASLKSSRNGWWRSLSTLSIEFAKHPVQQ